MERGCEQGPVFLRRPAGPREAMPGVEPRDRLMTTMRRGLAALWLISGLLKLQPAVGSGAFISNVLGPAAVQGQPAWLYHLMMAGANLWAAADPVSGYAVAAGEIALAGVLWAGRGRWLRRGLMASVAWGLVVWVMAEGLGGILTGSPTVMAGTPGSALLYAGMALLLLRFASTGDAAAFQRVIRQGLAVLWWGGALVQCLPLYWSPAGLGGVFGDVTMNGAEPAWVQQIINAAVLFAYRVPVPLNIVFVLVMGALGYAFWTGRLSLAARLGAWVWILLLFAVPQAFGGLLTGTATDLGSPAAIAVSMAAAAAPLARRSGRLQAVAPAGRKR